jgi:hypothetical protein
MNDFYQGFTIDTAAGKLRVPFYGIEGYVSWRPADLQYHAEHFDLLWNNADEMPATAKLRASHTL